MCEGIYSFTNYLSFDEYEHSFPYEILTVVYHYSIPQQLPQKSYQGGVIKLTYFALTSSGK